MFCRAIILDFSQGHGAICILRMRSQDESEDMIAPKKHNTNHFLYIIYKSFTNLIIRTYAKAIVAGQHVFLLYVGHFSSCERKMTYKG